MESSGPAAERFAGAVQRIGDHRPGSPSLVRNHEGVAVGDQGAAFFVGELDRHESRILGIALTVS